MIDKRAWKMAQLIPLLMVMAVSSMAVADIVVVCPITGVIDEGASVVVERAIREAEALGAKAIIFRVDTPGGRVDFAVKIAAAIGRAPMQTIAFIEGMGAISAGALISYSCDELIMTPGSNIGAATPVIPSAQGMLPTGEKEVSFMRAKMRALAESGGHNADIAQAMVDKDIELRAKQNEDGSLTVFGVTLTGASPKTNAPSPQSTNPLERLFDSFKGGIPGTSPPGTDSDAVSEDEDAAAVSTIEDLGAVVFEDGSLLVLASGKLLTLTPQESIDYGVISRTVETLDEAIEFFGLENVELHTITPNWAEEFLRFITGPTIAGLLLMLGMGGLYFEVKTPGFGVPGIIAAVSLLLLFGGHYVLGLTEIIDLVLLGIGVLLILAEIFLLPGFGVAGIAGLFCLVFGTYLALVDFTIPQFPWQYTQLREVGYSMGLACTSFLVLVFATWKMLPYTPVYRRLVLGATQQADEGFVVQTRSDESHALGLQGVATSMLRPAGRGRFGMENFDIVTRGEYIEKGKSVVIIQAEGNRYVVKEEAGDPA